MEIAVDMSLYPLATEFIPPIEAFIARLKATSGLKVVTNSLSTQVFGDYARVMEVLTREMGTTFAHSDKAVFVMKFVGPLTAVSGA